MAIALLSVAEKPTDDSGYVNGGFLVGDPRVLDRVENDGAPWEGKPAGFWHAMDTLRDKNHLENLWSKSEAPQKIWS